MRNKTTLLLAVICVLLLVWVLASCQKTKKTELAFVEKKASLIKENLDLNDRILSLEETLSKKTAELSRLEEDTKPLKEALIKLKLENESLKSEYKNLTAEKDASEDKYKSLSRKVAALEESPLIQKIQEAIDKEKNAEIKKFLQSVLQNLTLLQAGKPVSLAPIVVVSKEKAPVSAPEQPPLIAGERIGQVISIDKKNSVVVIDLGRKDSVKEGYICTILKEDKEFARGAIISVRYNMSAVFIDEIQYRNLIGDIREGDKVTIEEG